MGTWNQLYFSLHPTIHPNSCAKLLQLCCVRNITEALLHSLSHVLSFLCFPWARTVLFLNVDSVTVSVFSRDLGKCANVTRRQPKDFLPFQVDRFICTSKRVAFAFPNLNYLCQKNLYVQMMCCWGFLETLLVSQTQQEAANMRSHFNLHCSVADDTVQP